MLKCRYIREASNLLIQCCTIAKSRGIRISVHICSYAHRENGKKKDGTSEVCHVSRVVDWGWLCFSLCCCLF